MNMYMQLKGCKLFPIVEILYYSFLIFLFQLYFPSHIDLVLKVIIIHAAEFRLKQRNVYADFIDRTLQSKALQLKDRHGAGWLLQF